MTLNILLGEIQSRRKPVKRGENNIVTCFRRINETFEKCGEFYC